MDIDSVIKVEHVSKKYANALRWGMLYGIQDIGRNLIGLRAHSDLLRKREFWALDDVSFEVNKGEVLGIIGPNGAGKSTLLRLLNGIFWPDKGKITIKGKVGGLIEVAAGFHPSFTGRENIYLRGAILGMTKREVDKKLDLIIEFADIGDFINGPVKFFSSGMYVRLGFSIAIHCDLDVLLVDEILAVGDYRFQQKAFARIEEKIQSGVSIILVSHNLHTVCSMCNRVVVLDKGKIKFIGDTNQAVQNYQALAGRDTIDAI